MIRKSKYIVTKRNYDIPEGCCLYEASFKKKESGKLVWFKGIFSSEKEAIDKFVFLASQKFPKHKLYGGPLAVSFDGKL